MFGAVCHCDSVSTTISFNSFGACAAVAVVANHDQTGFDLMKTVYVLFFRSLVVFLARAKLKILEW